MEDNIKFISLSDLAESIRQIVESYLSDEQWITAEVSEVKINHSGHCYLELIDKSAQERMPSAVARGIIWSRSHKMISGYFRFQTGKDIAAGMRILVKCSVSYHPVYGLSLVISDIDPAYTLGEAERLRRETIELLVQEGVFDMNRELELPIVVQNIAVVSSVNAAGYQDFIKELEQSPYRFETTLFPAVVQGAEAEVSIIAALEAIAEAERPFDAVAIIRGGGSQNDLSCFDSYNVCSNIAQFPIPVLTGIGHDKDVSVADMVANMSMKTPTAVATALVEMAAKFAGILENMKDELTAIAESFLTENSRCLEMLALQLRQFTLDSIHRQQINIAATESRLMIRTKGILGSRSGQLDNLSLWLSQISAGFIRRNAAELLLLTTGIKAAAAAFINKNQQKLELSETRIESSDPKRILKKGYAIVRLDDRALTDAKHASVGETVGIELHHGRLTAEVKSKSNK